MICERALEMVINKTWAMPNKNTFTIKPIKELIEKYLYDGAVVVDPFANNSKYGTITNDLNGEFETDYHLDALEFLKQLKAESADFILYDPPYSITQASECYKNYGKEKLETNVANMKYWKCCKDECARVLKPGGVLISFGWNTNGAGLRRGFETLEILIVSHGGSKNDTLVTVEEKKQTQMQIEL